MNSEPGTYALVLRNRKPGPLRIGRLGTVKLQPGYCVYVGSAFGTGGLRARIKHHQRIAAHPHWHIDYLRAACDLVEVWFTVEPLCCEHAWAKGVAQLPGAEVPLPGFGSSDCDCDTHLVSFHRPPAVRKVRQLVANTVNVHR